MAYTRFPSLLSRSFYTFRVPLMGWCFSWASCSAARHFRLSMAATERIIYQNVDWFWISYPERTLKYVRLLITFTAESRRNEGKCIDYWKRSMFFLTQVSFSLIKKFIFTARSSEGLIFQRSIDTSICNSKRVALMIRELARPLQPTDKITCSSIREKKVSHSFGFSSNKYNKSLQEARSLYSSLHSFRFRSKLLEPRGGWSAH